MAHDSRAGFANDSVAYAGTRAARLGQMSPHVDSLAQIAGTELIRPDGRPTPTFRQELRRISNTRNAITIVLLYAQVIALIMLAVGVGAWIWPLIMVAMGRTHAQYASLMHEAAHRLLFSHRRVNDAVGRWVLGYPGFVSTDAYRRVHMAHHRREFGPEEPDIALYQGYPVGRRSLRRKLWRDLRGSTGLRLLVAQFSGLRRRERRVQVTAARILAVQAVIAVAMTIAAGPLAYLLLWLVPFLTVWRVINRLRSIAEHGGLDENDDRRMTTHCVARQALWFRCVIGPYNLGYHLAHHVDAGIPWRHLPRYHRALADSGYLGGSYMYDSYPQLWRALADGLPERQSAHSST